MLADAMRNSHSILLTLLTTLIAGCSAVPPVLEAEPEPQLQAPATRAPRTVNALAEIVGEWDIVRFDNHSPPRLDNDGQRHAYVDIGHRSLRFDISCNHSGMAGHIEGGALTPAAVDKSTQTAMGCGPEREARDATFFSFFRARPQVGLLPDGRLRIWNSHHELLLEQSSRRRLAMGPPLSEITGIWRVVSFMQFEGRDQRGQRGWGAMFAPGRLRIGGRTLSYSRCPTASLRVTYTSDFVLRRDSGAEPATTVDCRVVTPAPTEVEPMLAALLTQSPAAERVSNNRFILRSRDYAVVLTSEADYQRQFGIYAADWERHPG